MCCQLKQILEINGKSISLNNAGHIGCYRVAVADTIHKAPRSETVMSCNVCISAEEPLPKCLGIIEGDDDFLKSERAIIGKVLCYKPKVSSLSTYEP